MAFILAENPEPRTINRGVSWSQYETLLEKIGDSPKYRLTFLDETLEIMSLSRRHEVNYHHELSQ